MSFALIDAKKAGVPVATACAVLGVSESGYYAWKSRAASPRQRDDMVLLAHIRAEFSTSNETYGSPRMLVELREKRDRLHVTSCSIIKLWHCSLVYCVPRSEWCRSSRGRPRRHSAIMRASATRSAVIWARIDQPTIRREKRSSTTAT